MWRVSIALAPLVAGLIWLVHAAAGPVPAGPAVVSFSGGTYSSYGVPSFRVDAVNNGGSPATVHRLRVRFVNIMAPAVIADVTEQAGATVAAGQSVALTCPAPQAVVNTAVRDRAVSVTVTGWS
jgi:hypothetical protein